MRLRWVVRVALAAALCWLSGCGSSTPTPNPTPQITGFFPSEITAGSQAFTLFVSGTQFISTTTAQWNGSDRPTVYNATSTQLAVSITAADVQNAGLGEVTATSPAPGGGTSLAVSFTINPAHGGGPAITSLSPSSAALNGPAFTLTVNGTNFSSTDYVTWNGGLRDTTFNSSTQLTAQILASDLTQNIIAGVAVHTSQLGIASPSVSFQVGNAPSSNVKFPQVISTSALGGPADGFSSSPAMSADGRYVAFYSEARNLVLRGNSGGGAGNIFVRDTCLGATGCVPQTVAVDTAPDGSAPNGTSADQVSMSADGRYVAFTSSATNLAADTVPGGPQPRVYVRDICLGGSAPAGCMPETELVSVDPGRGSTGMNPSISADGRFVSFTTTLISGRPPRRIMVRDTCHGTTTAGCTPRSFVASVNKSGLMYVAPSARSAISGSGRYVAFASNTDGPRHTEIFLRDTCLGTSAGEDCEPSTMRVSVGADGQMGNADSGSPSISADGRFVVFQSVASNLSGGAGTGEQVYLRDTCAGPTAPLGCQPSTTLISSSDIPAGTVEGSYEPSISASGRYLSYVVQTQAQNAASVSGTVGSIAVYDTCFGARDACSPHVVELGADSNGDALPLTGDIDVRVPITDEGLAAFFTRQAVSALRTSGFGDVLLTTTPFQTQP
jgi:trimeric autotransporter adhesin